SGVQPDPPSCSQQLRTPMAPESIKVICGDNSIRVEAKRDLLGTGVLVQTTDVTLGGCAATEEDPKAQILIFESELHGCGSQLLMSEESFIYVFTLLYTPSPPGGSPIVRTIDVSVSIECHYRRKNDVSSDVLKPTWAPFSETKASEESLYFSLRLMTDDWQFPRSSTQFFLGDMMKFEASVEQFHHIPLRVTVDSCVATVVPNVDTVPRYAFLGNNGCMFDSQLTGSSSHFLPQSHKDKLQFELEAFRFQHGNSGVVRYATLTNKYDEWREASGIHHACSCCDTDCRAGTKSSLTVKGKQQHTHSHKIYTNKYFSQFQYENRYKY
uniref:Zona pellucida sperm-binding protein 3 n=1 Tax=Neolamprologus brichardi TaxID=32507 RepID=A0A3Q4H817_NEOBR